MECKGQWHRGPWHFGNIARSHIIYTRSYSWPDKQVHMYTFYWKSFQVSLYSHRQRRGLLIYACAAAARALSGRMLETIAFLDGRASHHFQTLYKQDRTALTVGQMCRAMITSRYVLFCMTMLSEHASSFTPHMRGSRHIKANFSSAFRVDEPLTCVGATITVIET